MLRLGRYHTDCSLIAERAANSGVSPLVRPLFRLGGCAGAAAGSRSNPRRSRPPADTARAAEYADGPTGDIPDIAKGLSAREPPDAEASEVAEAIARVVDMPFGKRPFRVHIDPSLDGAEVVNGGGME